MQKNVFLESIELDEKQTPSDKIFHIVGLSCGTLAIALLLICLIIFLAFPDAAVLTWILAFYPVLILSVVGMFCSTAQLLRNRYFSSIAAFAFNIGSIITEITVIVVQAVIYQEVFIIPFIWF